MTILTLHKTKGVNPRLTYCPRCGGDGQSLILIGTHDHKGKCSRHGLVYGARFSCPAIEQGAKCGKRLSDVKQIDEHERLYDSVPCGPCLKEIEAHKAIVSEGGVYFKCDECHATGVVKDSPLARIVRDQLKVPAPGECGVAFEHCSEHATTEQPKG